MECYDRQDWLLDSLPLIDYSEEVLLIESTRIAIATRGGIAMQDIREMPLEDIDIVIDEIKKINEERKDG